MNTAAEDELEMLREKVGEAYREGKFVKEQRSQGVDVVKRLKDDLDDLRDERDSLRRWDMMHIMDCECGAWMCTMSARHGCCAVRRYRVICPQSLFACEQSVLVPRLIQMGSRDTETVRFLPQAGGGARDGDSSASAAARRGRAGSVAAERLVHVDM